MAQGLLIWLRMNNLQGLIRYKLGAFGRVASLAATITAVAALSTACLEAPAEDGMPTEEEMKSAEAADQALQDADVAIDFDPSELPNVEHQRLEWDVVYGFGSRTEMPKDYLPVGRDWVLFPVAIIKLLLYVPDTVADWFRAADYARWVVPNTTNAPLTFTVSASVKHLNWRLARGKASLRRCKVDAQGGEYDCKLLGSVKRGTKTHDTYSIWTDDDERRIPVRNYGRDYEITIPPGETFSIYLKHKLECNGRAWELVSAGFCLVHPVASALFVSPAP